MNLKEFMNAVAKFKMALCVIFIGELALYILSKTIVERIYSISFLDIIYLSLTAVAITAIVGIFNTEKLGKRLNVPMLLLLQYLAVMLIVLLANFLFNFYSLDGLSYLYFVLFVTGSYLGGLLGMYILSLADVRLMNNRLQRYKKS